MSQYRIDSDWPGPFVNGEWHRDEANVQRIVSPSTQEVVARVGFGDRDLVDAAYDAAASSAGDWEDDPQGRVELLREVQRLLDRYQDDIQTLISLESGGTILKARLETRKTRNQIEHAIQLLHACKHEEGPSQVPGKRNIIQRNAAGTVGVITPWNVPLKLAMQSISPALALGNTVVLKPAPETPISGGLVLARLFEEAGAPPGIINVVPGFGSEVGERVVSHPKADVISFTGSSAVGREVGRTAVGDFKEVMLELGGNNPHIVTDEADIDLAVAAGVFATFSNQGQACISINRHLVQESIYQKYVDRLAERASDLTIGDPVDTTTDLGPVINERQRDRILEFIEGTLEAGAHLETGGSNDGLFVDPTVLSNVSNDMPLACNEHFGPVAPVIPFADDEEAIALANDTEYGLAASVHCEDRERAWKIANSLEAGMVHINDQTVNSEPTAPFGGVKASGIGRHNGQWAIDKYTEVKWVSVQDTPRSYPL